MVWLSYSVREQIRITDMYTLFQLHYDSGYAFPGETHNFWECLYVMEGEVCASGNERVVSLHLYKYHTAYRKPSGLLPRLSGKLGTNFHTTKV